MNWEEIKLEYVTSDISYRELSEKHGVSFSSLSKIAVKEKWSKERGKHRKNVATKARQKIETRAAKRLATEMEMAEAISDILQAAVSAPEQFVSERDEDGSIKRYSLPEISAALAALSSLERSKRSLYGMLSEKEKQTLELAREKIDVARSRVGPYGGDASESGVVLLPAVGDAGKSSAMEGEEK